MTFEMETKHTHIESARACDSNGYLYSTEMALTKYKIFCQHIMWSRWAARRALISRVFYYFLALSCILNVYKINIWFIYMLDWLSLSGEALYTNLILGVTSWVQVKKKLLNTSECVVRATIKQQDIHIYLLFNENI